MIKRVLIGVMVVGLSGVLVVGAVNRTATKASQTAEGDDQGRHGQRVDSVEGTALTNVERGGYRGGQDQSAGQGGAASVASNGGGYRGGQDQNAGQGQDAGQGGAASVAGDGGGYRGGQDQNGGQGGQDAGQGGGTSVASNGGGYRGGQGQSAGQGEDARQGGAASVAGNGGTGQAEVEAWLTLRGAVASVDADALTVSLDDGGAMTVEGRAWSFAQTQGFWAQAGDAVALTGFYDGDKFEAGQISNLTSGQSVPLRDDAGRPLWAGRGRRGGV